MRNIILTTLIALVASLSLSASETNIKLNALMDGYYAIDNNKMSDPTDIRPLALNNQLKDQFGINFAMLSASADSKNWYGKVTIATGDVAKSFFSNSIYEAFAGYKFTDKISLDAGIFPTHIGGEGFISNFNWLSSYSVLTFIGPFYHTGMRINYNPTENIALSALIANSNSTYPDNNKNKSYGLFAKYYKNSFFVSYAGYYGNDVANTPPGGLTYMHHNIVAQNTYGKIDVKAQIDVVTKADSYQETLADDVESALYYGISLSALYHINSTFESCLRVSYYNNEKDPFGGVAYYPAVTGIDATAGITWRPTADSFLRLEGRLVQLDEGENGIGKVFNNGEEMTNSFMEAAITYGVNFELLNLLK